MWNEHFGIGVVEYQAAGLVPVVNDSGGPKLDIAVEWECGETGFKASTEEEYASAFERVLGMAKGERLKMRTRARSRARAFSEEEFERAWVRESGWLIQMNEKRTKKD